MKPGVQDAVHELIGRIYEAGTDPACWPAVLGEIARAVHSHSTVFACGDFGTHAIPFLQAYNLDRAYLQSLHDYYADLYPYRMPFLQHATPEQTFHGAQVLSEPELMGTEYYNDWMKPQDMHHVAGVWLERSGDRITFLNVERPRTQGPHGDGELRTLHTLGPHLTRALAINRRLKGTGAVEGWAEALLNGLDFGLVLIGEFGTFRWANARAEAILRQGEGLRRWGRRLTTSDAAQAEHFARMLDNAVRIGLGRGAAAGAALRLCRPPLPPLQVLVAPLPAGRDGLRALGPEPLCAAVFIGEPGAAQPLDADALRLLYGFTIAEAHLAAALAQGRELAEIAASFRISWHTARVHLRAIRRKTGVGRQADLVRLLLSGPAAFAPRVPASPTASRPIA